MLDRLSPAPVSAPEKPLGSPDISRREEVKNATQEWLLALQFDMAIGRLSQNLRSSYSAKHIEFDMASFEKRMREAIARVRDDQKIPTIAKRKFLEDILSKTSILSQISREDILNLQKTRTEDSLGQEASELELRFGTGSEAVRKIQGFYLSKILDRTIGEYIEPVAESLSVSFSQEKTRVGNQEFNARNLDRFNGQIQELDATYGLDIASGIKDFSKGSRDISEADLYREMGQHIVRALQKQSPFPDAKRVMDFIRNGNLTERSKNGKSTEIVLADGSKKDVVDIVLAYKKCIGVFQWTEKEVRETSTTALSENVVAKTKAILWMEQLKSEFDYIEPEQIEKKLKEASLSDLIILLGQLAQLPPVFGDILSGVTEGRNMFRGIDSDGKILSSFDRSISWVFAVLGITVVGGNIQKLLRSRKFIALMKSFSLAGKYLPEKLSDFIQKGGVLNERTKCMLARIFPGIEPLYLMPKNSKRSEAPMVPGKTLAREAISSRERMHETIAYTREWKNLLLHAIHGTSEAEVRRELTLILQKTGAETVRFDSRLGTTEKRLLGNILAKNHPLIEVLRLLPGNNVLNVSFAGIKKLNDTYGQAFVDALLASSKDHMLGSIYAYVQRWENGAEHIRLVRDDYKNFTLSMPPDMDSKALLFGKTGTKANFIASILHDMEDEIALLAKNKHRSPERIRKDILEHWSFGVGTSRVEPGARNEQKLHAFAEAELVSRDTIHDTDITVGVFDTSRPLRFGEASVRQESDIIRKWDTKTFISDGLPYPIITHIGGQSRIHPELLRQVRKNGAESTIQPTELAKEVKRYIDTLNAGFDFIPPVHDLDRDLIAAQKMSEDFWKWKIEATSLLMNFKGVKTREAFMQMTEKKPGMRLFIDIKDMGLQNLQSFQFLSRKTASMQADSRDMLKAGKEVTDNFMVLIRKIRASHPDAEIALGWDEIYIFLPNVRKSESTRTLESIHEKLEISQLEWRVSSSFETEGAEKIFKRLDESTALHKMVENILRQGRSASEQRKIQHETISLELWPNIRESEVVELMNNNTLKQELARILQWVQKGWWILSGQIELPGIGQLIFRHDHGILHFTFKKP